MANGVFNIAKGRFVHLATLPAASDALIVVLFVASGLQADDLLNNHDDLAAVKAANTEATFTNYARKTVSASVTVTIDDTNNWVDVDMPDQTWTAAGGASNNALGKLAVCYDADTGAGTDANITPLTYHDFVATTDGNDLIATVATAGFARAA